MKQNGYSIKDAKANTFGTPYFAINDQVAVRSFQQAASDPNTTINKNPEDFNLYRIGSFDDASGEFNPEKQPQFITGAVINEKTETVE
jgi:hypothetical protein